VATADGGLTAQDYGSQSCTPPPPPPPPSATCFTINAVKGVAISPVTFIGSGGVGGPYTFSATGLPTGLTLSSTGTLSGTPIVTGTFNYTVTITDKAGNKGTLKCSLCVTPPPPPPTVSCPPNKGGKVGTYFTTTIPVTGGVAPFTFSIATGSLPPGLTLNSKTGVISGTPTTDGTFNFTIKVVDAAGNVAYSACDSSCTDITDKFDFIKECGKFGKSHSYNQNGYTVTAYGYDSYGNSQYLNGRSSGDDDDGLGIYGNYDNGIDSNSFVQVDVSNMVSQGADDVMFTIDSRHYGETYDLYGSNSLGSKGTLIRSNCKADGHTEHLPTNYKYICVKARNKCVHIQHVDCHKPCQCSITISKKGCTYSKNEYGHSGYDGWNKSHGSWGNVYGGSRSCVKIGGSHSYTFTSADDAANFLTKSGNPGPAYYSSTNSTSGNDFAAEVLSLQMNVDLSNSGVTAPGLGSLKIQSGILRGWTVQQVLSYANAVLGGDAYLYGFSYSDATDILSDVNTALDSGNYDDGYLDIN
jgi:hypothetical protein